LNDYLLTRKFSENSQTAKKFTDGEAIATPPPLKSMSRPATVYTKRWEQTWKKRGICHNKLEKNTTAINVQRIIQQRNYKQQNWELYNPNIHTSAAESEHCVIMVWCYSSANTNYHWRHGGKKVGEQARQEVTIYW